MKDTVIVGAGPAGLTAFLYATLYRLDAVCIGDNVGGKLLLAPQIVDYPGFTKLLGKEFIDRLLSQLSQIKIASTVDTILSIKQIHGQVDHFEIMAASSNTYQTKTVLLSTGNPNKQAGDHAFGLGEMCSVKNRNKRYIVNEHMMTNVTGIFAAGDSVVYPEGFEQLSTAVSSGIKAAGGICQYLTGKSPPILWGSARIPRFV